MNSELIEKIRDSVDLLELIKEYVPAVKKAGRTYKACCPFHHEKTPSFSISPDKGLFYCFGCQTGGDVFGFLMKIENLSFNEAARKLAERAGIEWHQEDALTEEEKNRLQDYKIMDFAKNFYHKQLMSQAGASGRNYIKERHLTKETAQKFQLGYALFDGLTAVAKAQGYNLQDLKRLGLASINTGTDYFKNRLMFPIFNHRGEAVAFGGRVMGEGQPKYLNSPETPLFTKSRILYALNFAGPAVRKEGRAILLEGYMDVIAAHQAGVENCVAPLGTSFTAQHASLLKRYTSETVVVFDPDNAGINAALRAALILVESGIYVRVLTLPEGLDPDEFIHKHGADAFRKLVATAQDIINYQIDRLTKGAQAIGPQEKTAIATQLVETIKKQPDAIIRQEWAKLVANRLNIEPSIILSKLTEVAKTNYKNTPSPVAAAPTKPAAKQDLTPQSELDLARLLLKYPRYIDICKDLQEDHFKNKDLYLILKGVETIRQNSPHIEDIAKELIKTLPQFENTILKLSLEAMPKDMKPQMEIEACYRAINKAALSKKFEELNQKISAYPTGQVPVELLKEQMEIQKKLKS
ncbi:MAG: DNA primase [Elusimicrobiota bacterium]|jgi:DNA primase|nr:DNA primase [Elusimicrobiota bacterium]